MFHFFDIDAIFFVVLGYPMSYIEFFGTITGAGATWLSARAHVLSWPIGLVSVTIFFVMFYQIQLYPDMFLQIFFFITNLFGWWEWKHPKIGQEDRKKQLKISQLTVKKIIFLLVLGGVSTALFGTIADRLHYWAPVLFNKQSAFPYLDSFTSVMSVVATFLLIQKKLETWYVWLVVDAISAYMYFVKGIKVVGIEYAVYCLIALIGAYYWTHEYRSYLQVVNGGR